MGSAKIGSHSCMTYTPVWRILSSEHSMRVAHSVVSLWRWYIQSTKLGQLYLWCPRSVVLDSSRIRGAQDRVLSFSSENVRKRASSQTTSMARCFTGFGVSAHRWRPFLIARKRNRRTCFETIDIPIFTNVQFELEKFEHPGNQAKCSDSRNCL